MKTESRRAKCFSNYKFNFVFLHFDISYQNNTILENNICIKLLGKRILYISHYTIIIIGSSFFLKLD